MRVNLLFAACQLRPRVAANQNRAKSVFTGSVFAIVSILIALFLWLPGSHAAPIIEPGSIASVGADFSAGALGQPPTQPFSQNVFFDFRDISTTASGGPLNAGGWAGIGWTVTPSNIAVTGQSTEGYNGAFSPGNGFVYGRGHADLTLSLSLDQSYHYGGVVQGNVSGLLVGNDGGFLTAGPHTIVAGTLGKSGGFSGTTPDNFVVNVSLTPARIPTAAEILSGSVQPTITDGGHRLNLQFTPGGGLTLQEAASALGVTHFNWEQFITHTPPDWTVTDSGTELLVGAQFLDPIPSSTDHYIIKSPLTSTTLTVDAGGKDPLDNKIFYYNEPDEIHKHEHSTFLGFNDTPTFPAEFMQAGDYVGFETRLVGVREDGSLLSWFNYGTNVSWKDNAVYITDPNDIGAGEVLDVRTFKVSEDLPIPDIVSGGVFDVQFVSSVPEPSQAYLIVVGIGLLFGHFWRIRRMEVKRRAILVTCSPIH